MSACSSCASSSQKKKKNGVAKHRLREYSPAAGKGHTEEPRRLQNKHTDAERAGTNPIQSSERCTDLHPPILYTVTARIHAVTDRKPRAADPHLKTSMYRRSL